MRFTEDHEWLEADGDIVTVGITNHAAEALGEIVFIELPEVGDEKGKGDDAAVIESVKAASDILTPLDGEIVEVNSAIEETPTLVNEDPMTNWFFKMKVADGSVVDDYMTEDEYKATLD